MKTVKTTFYCEKNVLMSTMIHPQNGFRKDDSKKKPNFYKFYNFTKGGIKGGQLNGYYIVRSQSNRLDLAACYYIINKIKFEFEFVNDRRVLSTRKNHGFKG